MEMDFLKTYQSYKKQYGAVRLPLVSPFYEIVRKYTAVILRADLERTHDGIQAVLKHELQQIHWWEEVLRIPFHRNTLPYTRAGEQNVSELLSSSLILSLDKYRDGLRDTASGLSSCLKADIARGLYLACQWVARGVPLTSPSNHMVVAFSSPGDEYGQS